MVTYTPLSVSAYIGLYICWTLTDADAGAPAHINHASHQIVSVDELDDGVEIVDQQMRGMPQQLPCNSFGNWPRRRMTAKTATLTTHSDNIGYHYISQDGGGSWTSIGTETNRMNSFSYSLSEITINTMIKVKVVDEGVVGAFIGTVLYDGQQYSTSSPLSAGHWELIGSSDGVTSPLVYSTKTSSPWSISTDAIASDAYWVWNKNVDNTMYFHFSFSSLDAFQTTPRPSSNPTLTPTPSSTNHPTQSLTAVPTNDPTSPPTDIPPSLFLTLSPSPSPSQSPLASDSKPMISISAGSNQAILVLIATIGFLIGLLLCCQYLRCLCKYRLNIAQISATQKDSNAVVCAKERGPQINYNAKQMHFHYGDDGHAAPRQLQKIPKQQGVNGQSGYVDGQQCPQNPKHEPRRRTLSHGQQTSNSSTVHIDDSSSLPIRRSTAKPSERESTEGFSRMVTAGTDTLTLNGPQPFLMMPMHSTCETVDEVPEGCPNINSGMVTDESESEVVIQL